MCSRFFNRLYVFKLSLICLAFNFVEYTNQAEAQESTVDAVLFTGQLTSDENSGNLSRGVVPLTRSNGDPVTLDDYNDVTGTFTVAARADGSGSDVTAKVEGLLPNEIYSFWAGYWPLPDGFPGAHLSFGAITENGDGSDNWAKSDAQGKITKNLFQRAGEMTMDGHANSYAPISPVLDLNGQLTNHDGYVIGVAYHFGDYPATFDENTGLIVPAQLTPGSSSTWALHAIATVDPVQVPEPSSIVLLILAGCLCVCRVRKASDQ